MSRFNNSNPLLILLIALLILISVSFIPLNKISNGFLKDFSFLSDIVPAEEDSSENVVVADDNLDPDIAELLKNEQDNNDSIANNNLTDSISDDYVYCDTSIYTEPVIEDYTPNRTGLQHLKMALGHRGSKTVRIAFLGDSYIEGDIFTQNIREALQDNFGGSGIGYTPVHSEIAGFRRSVNQTSSGWKIKNITESKANMILSGVYCNATGLAKTQFKGSKKLRHLENWNTSTLLFISPDDVDINVSQNKGEEQTHHFTGSQEVQALEIDGQTSNISISVNSNNFTALGLYLNDNNGIAVDNMPIRGYAGIRHHSISAPIIEQMRQYIDYDLIVIEYGINAISSKQLNYNSYTSALKNDILKIKSCYPNADILILGVGDRGERRNGEIQTMKAVPAMIKAQRRMAQELGVLFWDTQLAMGGNNSIVEWTNNKDTNKDYTHLSFKGGARLGKLFSDRLIEEIGK